MTLEQVKKKDAIDRATLHTRLREWATATAGAITTDPTISPDGTPGVMSWIHVRDANGDIFTLHADVRRSPTVSYLQQVDRYGDGLAWTIIPKGNGRENLTAFGPHIEPIKPFYMYLVKRADGTHV